MKDTMTILNFCQIFFVKILNLAESGQNFKMAIELLIE